MLECQMKDAVYVYSFEWTILANFFEAGSTNFLFQAFLKIRGRSHPFAVPHQYGQQEKINR
jgi:hypothetical protein